MRVCEKEYQAMPPELQRLFTPVRNIGKEEVMGVFPDTQSHGGGKATYGGKFGNGKAVTDQDAMSRFAGDSGSAARFFYQAKAQNSERVFQCRECGGRWHGKAECGHKDIRSHPTVKPVALMRHLVRLVTPPGGTVLDPFAGTGTTGAACVLEGFQSVLIEREPDHVGDIVFRLQNMTAAPVSETAVTSAGRQGVLF